VTDHARDGIDYFGRGHWLTTLQERLSLSARRRMFELWRQIADPDSPEQTLLDYGTTPDCERLDSNCFIPWFHREGLRITLYSPERIDHLRRPFPYVEIWPAEERPPHEGFPVRLPMADSSYDWVVSSAVLEHVGNDRRQLEFLRECGRVGRGLFLTSPDRRHWLEFHTKLPLLHWLPKPWHRSLLKMLGKTFWAQEQNLNLLSKTRLRALAVEALGDAFEVSVRTVWTLGMPSNLVLLATRRRRINGRDAQDAHISRSRGLVPGGRTRKETT